MSYVISSLKHYQHFITSLHSSLAILCFPTYVYSHLAVHYMHPLRSPQEGAGAAAT